MRILHKSWLLIAQVMTVFMLMPSLADSSVYTWEDEAGVVTYSDDPSLAPEGIQVKLWSSESSGQEVSEARVTEEVPEQPSAGLSTVITQGEFAVHLAGELGYGQDLTPEEATRILSDLRIAPPLGKWERNAAMTPELTSRLRTLTVAAPQMGWISVTPEEALFAFDSAAALLGVTIPVDLDIEDTEANTASPRAVVVPPLVYISPPPYIIAPYYSWVTVPSGFLWHGTTVHGFFALHSVHINNHFFNGHRFTFKPRFVRHHFLDHLRGHHLVERHVIHRPVDRIAGKRHNESHFVNKNIIRRPTKHLLRRIPPYARPFPRIRNHQRESRNSLRFRRSHRGGFRDRKHIIRHRTDGGRHMVRHLPRASQHLVTRRTVPSTPHALTMPRKNSRYSASPQRHRKGGRHRSASVRHWSRR